MNDHTDLQVIECNRLHSEEAKSRNNENYALWTNNLQDIVHLEPGDKVSVHGAMVSERGAGQSSSIEIKGESLGFQKTFNHIVATPSHIAGSNASDMIVGADTIEAVFTPTIKTIRDDEGNFLMSYYVPADGKNYIDLPRRFWLDESASARYTSTDNQTTGGMSFSDPFNQRDTENTAKVDKYAFYDDFYQIYVGGANKEKLSKPKKDNSRFTIMMAEKTFFSASSASTNKTSMPPQYLREPEYQVYYPYRELKSINVPSGFNSPEYIATEITRQLQSVVSQNTFSVRDNDDSISDNPDLPGYPIPITRTTETETYKPFNVASTTHETATKTLLTNFINASNKLDDGYEYLKQYHIVACKRPELYETGRAINRSIDGSLRRTLGAKVETATTGDYYDLSIDYDDTALLGDFRKFILAQEKYPEIWNIFSDKRTPYNANDTINNSRWCHINRFKNASMTHYTGADATTILNTATLGFGGYKDFAWNTADVPNAKFIKQCNSVILPFQYDPTQKDKYYELPDESLGEKTYGCFGRSPLGCIRIYGTKYNGVASALLTMLRNASAKIEEDRKIGFDQHFSAPGMNYVLPCNGYAGVNAWTSTDTFVESDLTNGYAVNGASPYSINPLENYKLNQLYLGANAPRLNYDGTHFTISDLHTAINSGNNNQAGNPFFTAVEREALTETDVIYTMNPREQYNDLTTARKPYILDPPSAQQNGSAKLKSTYMNTNLEPWRIYDSLTGVLIEDFNLTAEEWQGTLWELLGFTYKQFHSTKNTRLSYISYDNANDLSIIATNAEVNEGDTKIYNQNMYGTPLFSNMLPIGATFNDNSSNVFLRYYPEIKQKTQSIQIIADNLPTRMIRGYYTIRSNLITDTPFIGGKVNNTQMPIIGIVNKINNFGDFVFGEQSDLVFTLTKPLRLASLTCSIHDPDGSYARVSEQSTILFKLEKDRKITYNVAQEILQEQQQK